MMARIICKNKTVEVNDGDFLTDACDNLGVPMSCRCGICGICRVEILQGMENLSPLTDKEKDANLYVNERLACECKILKGEVKIKY